MNVAAVQTADETPFALLYGHEETQGLTNSKEQTCSARGILSGLNLRGARSMGR